jgi:hypothetical protein
MARLLSDHSIGRLRLSKFKIELFVQHIIFLQKCVAEVMNIPDEQTLEQAGVMPESGV